MSDFEVLKRIYLKTKRENFGLLNNALNEILIPNAYTFEIKNVIDDPTNNDELQIAYTFLELSKRIYKYYDILSNEDVIKPFETIAYKYIMDSIRYQVDSAYDSLANLFKGNKEEANKREIQMKFELRELAREISGNNQDEYYKLLSQINILLLFMNDIVVDRIMESEYDVTYSSYNKRQKYLATIEECDTNARTFLVECTSALFDKDEEKKCGFIVAAPMDCEEVIKYLDVYKKYVSSLVRSRRQ